MARRFLVWIYGPAPELKNEWINEKFIYKIDQLQGEHEVMDG